MPPRIEGLPAVRRGLGTWKRETRIEISRALQEGAEHIRDVAKAIVPFKTGELRGAIEVRENVDDFKATGAVGNFGRMVSGVAGRIQRFIGVFPSRAGDPGWYAAFVEYGTAARTEGQRYFTKGGRGRIAKASAIGPHHPGTKPKPFLIPAFFSQRQFVLGRINRALNKAIKKVASGS
jgi:HK97 gp10 family phage protein